MLHHVSFNARDPRNVARVLAEMLGATALRAPSPPFPSDSWFVSCGDSAGSFLEVLPWGNVLDPEAPFGIDHDPAMRPKTGGDVLVSTPFGVGVIQEAAAGGVGLRTGGRSIVQGR